VTPQRAPEFFFVVRLVATKLAGGLDRVHAERMRVARKNSSPARAVSLSSPKGGEGWGEEAKITTMPQNPPGYYGLAQRTVNRLPCSRQ
jgi:hypothetical protein